LITSEWNKSSNLAGSSFPKHPDCDVSLRGAGFNGEAIRSSSVLVVKTHIPHPSWTDGMTHKTSFRKDVSIIFL